MSATASLNGVQTRKKRVLPTRSRRGGPGVGSCDVDVMILDMHKRRSENDPLVPPDTNFFLTTDSALEAELALTAALDLNTHANERYFDRPEVLKAFREQLIIETPQFVHVADLPSVGVGGRFRPRGSADNLIDTSDAAYEKRHRKYESFEKRLRLREKEKLKHEHYKLKERIEQLRSMDRSAFLSLPASNFTPADVQVLDIDDGDGSNSQDMHMNGLSDEGERRRREMLDVALSLEERYRMLLPPERIRKTNMNSWTEQETRSFEENEEPPRQEGESSKTKEPSGLKLKFKLPIPQQNVALPPTHQTPAKKAKQTALSAARPLPLRYATNHYQAEASPTLNCPEPPVTNDNVAVVVDTSETNQAEVNEPSERAVTMSPQPFMSGAATSVTPAPLPATPMSNREITPPETTRSPDVQEDDIPLAVRLRTSMHISKRPRLSLSPTLTHMFEEPIQHSPPQISTSIGLARQQSVPPIESINTSLSAPIFVRIKQQKQKPLALQRIGQKPRQYSTSRKEEAVCMLMVAAVRSSAGTKSRNQMRHITAFGAKVPPAVDDIKDFELPTWVWSAEEEDESMEQHDELEPNGNDSAPEVDPDGQDGGGGVVHQINVSNGPPSQQYPAAVRFLSIVPPIEVLSIPESSIRGDS